MKYLLKKCCHQELGSMKSSKRPSRGQYLLVSKSEEALSLFPPLSTTRQNDFRLVPIYPLYVNDKVYCRFVYHNDKYHASTAKNPRNEYRLYLNREVQGGTLKFSEGGIIVVRMVDETDYESGLYLDYAGSHGKLFKKYSKILQANRLGSRRNHAVFDGEIKEFERSISRLDASQKQIKVAKEDIGFLSKVKTDISQLFSEKQFRDFVSVAYQHKCAITGTVIAYKD